MNFHTNMGDTEERMRREYMKQDAFSKCMEIAKANNATADVEQFTCMLDKAIGNAADGFPNYQVVIGLTLVLERICTQMYEDGKKLKEISNETAGVN